MACLLHQIKTNAMTWHLPEPMSILVRLKSPKSMKSAIQCEIIECAEHTYGFGMLSLHIDLIQGLYQVKMLMPEMAEGEQSDGLPGCAWEHSIQNEQGSIIARSSAACLINKGLK